MTKTIIATLEELIQTNGIAHVLECIVNICYAKAEKARENKDRAQANAWLDAAWAIDDISTEDL